MEDFYITIEDSGNHLEDFAKFMAATTESLNLDAHNRADYFRSMRGEKLESVVIEAMQAWAAPYRFNPELIRHTDKQHFPDIVSNKYFGVEVKSTQSNHWKSIDGDEYGGDAEKYINSLPVTEKYNSGFALNPAIEGRLPLIDAISSLYRIGPRYDINNKYKPLDASSIVKEYEELGEDAPVKDFGSFIHNINENNFVDTGGDDYFAKFKYNRGSSKNKPSSQTQNTEKENKQENKQENTPENKMTKLMPTGLGDGY